MKTIKLMFAIAMMVFVAQKSISQNAVTGLYLTADDYAHHKLSFVTGGNSKNCIHLNEFMESGKVVVKYNGKTQTLLKSEIFGYSCDQQDYRYFNNVAYKIIDTTDFFIYSAPKLEQQGKGLKPVERFYFSSTARSEIERLSIKNLEAAYASNIKFRYMIESTFATDNSLTSYDAAVKEYKVKYLYEHSSSM
jgi:hypothetical protein